MSSLVGVVIMMMGGPGGGVMMMSVIVRRVVIMINVVVVVAGSSPRVVIHRPAVVVIIDGRTVVVIVETLSAFVGDVIVIAQREFFALISCQFNGSTDVLCDCALKTTFPEKRIDCLYTVPS